MGLTGEVPLRVSGDVKAQILDLIDGAVAAGASHRWACERLGVGDDRVHRWRARLAATGSLDDARPGGTVFHAVTPQEVQAILDLFERWSVLDRSHRKLAYRGSWLGIVYVSPSTVRRVLEKHGLSVPEPQPRPPAVPLGWPAWLVWEPNRIWCWDTSKFTRARAAAFAIVDVVSRKWINTIVSVEESNTQAQLLFEDALAAEDLTATVDGLAAVALDEPPEPINLALSDNGAPMIAKATNSYLATRCIAQRLGRPGMPTDQAWIESLFGHIKAEWPHLEAITDHNALRSELERVRRIYNGLRLHAGIGYVTPNDEHEGRGPDIRRRRAAGLQQARLDRIGYHRTHPTNQPPNQP